MTGLSGLIRRDSKMFFKDKGMFFTSLITPIILLVLYATFLADVYKESFAANLPAGFNLPEGLIDGFVGSQLFSSLLAVSCVTVTFCSNMLMVQDKVSGARFDLTVSPVKSSTMALGYYISSVLTTLIVCYGATGVCFLYLSKVGWYLSAADVIKVLADVFLLVLFGTAISSVINFFLSSQGQISAVGTIVSAGYGFICGAYMPISQFGEGLQKVLSFLPGTYGTALIRNHAMNGVFRETSEIGFPSEVIKGIRDSIDCNVYFFEDSVSIGAMYAILGGAIALLILAYVLLNVFVRKRSN